VVWIDIKLLGLSNCWSWDEGSDLLKSIRMGEEGRIKVCGPASYILGDLSMWWLVLQSVLSELWDAVGWACYRVCFLVALMRGLITPMGSVHESISPGSCLTMGYVSKPRFMELAPPLL
jgi:hypothetical protein